MADLIDRAKLIEELQAFKTSLGDIVFGWLIDRVIERVKAQPAAEPKPAEVKADSRAFLPLIDIIEHTESGLLEE